VLHACNIKPRASCRVARTREDGNYLNSSK
jgi:hypothetical protein